MHLSCTVVLYLILEILSIASNNNYVEKRRRRRAWPQAQCQSLSSRDVRRGADTGCWDLHMDRRTLYYNTPQLALSLSIVTNQHNLTFD